MNGSIRKRGKDSWELTIDLGRDSNGKRQRKFVNVKGKKSDGQRRLRELLAAYDKGLPLDTNKETLGNYLVRWLNTRSNDLAPHTLRGYEGCIRLYLVPHLGHIRVDQLQAIQVQEMEDALINQGLSGTTVVQAHRILRKALGDAVKWGLAWRNVTDTVTPPKKSRREMSVLNPQQLKKLLEAKDGSVIGSVISVAAHTGLRRAELIGLQWQDIDFERATLSVRRTLQLVPRRGYVVTDPKSARGKRVITLGPQLVATLRRHRAAQAEERLSLGTAWQDGDWVFTRPDGRPLDPTIVSRQFQKLIRELELPHVRFHDLRHTHATLLLAQNIHPKIVQERLGHSTISITLDTYSHVLPGLQEKAASAFESILDAVDENRA